MRVETHPDPPSAFAAGLDRLSARQEMEWSLAWLAAEHERIAPGFRYLVAGDGPGGPAAAAICLPVPHALTHTAYKPRDLLLGGAVAALIERGDGPARDAMRRVLAELRTRLPWAATDTLAVAVPSSTRPGVVWAAGPEAGVERAIEAIVAAAERLAEAAGAAIVAFANVRDEPAWAPLRRVLERRGYAAAVTAADAVLDVVHGSLDEYLDGFSSRRRRALRRERRRFVEAGVRVVAGAGELLAEDLVDLQVAHFVRHGHPTTRASVRDRFRRARTLPGLRVLRAEIGHRLLGFATFCEQEAPERRIVGRLVAFAANDVDAYFNLAYYELIRHAIERSFSTIHYGTDTYQAKVARGCRLVPLLTYLKPLSAAAAPVTEAAAFCDGIQRAWLRETVQPAPYHRRREANVASTSLASRTPTPAMVTGAAHGAR